MAHRDPGADKGSEFRADIDAPAKKDAVLGDRSRPAAGGRGDQDIQRPFAFQAPHRPFPGQRPFERGRFAVAGVRIVCPGKAPVPSARIDIFGPYIEPLLKIVRVEIRAEDRRCRLLVLLAVPLAVLLAMPFGKGGALAQRLCLGDIMAAETRKEGEEIARDRADQSLDMGFHIRSVRKAGTVIDLEVAKNPLHMAADIGFVTKLSNPCCLRLRFCLSGGFGWIRVKFEELKRCLFPHYCRRYRHGERAVERNWHQRRCVAIRTTILPATLRRTHVNGIGSGMKVAHEKTWPECVFRPGAESRSRRGGGFGHQFKPKMLR